jgi:hypothetical protein
VYAIVKAGGRQEKVAVGDTVIVDRIDAKAGAAVSFPALLVVEGATVTSDAKALAGVKVTGEIVRTKRSKDRHPSLQEQDWLSPSSRFPFPTYAREDHRDYEIRQANNKWQVKRESPQPVTVAIQMRSILESSVTQDRLLRVEKSWFANAEQFFTQDKMLVSVKTTHYLHYLQAKLLSVALAVAKL